MVQTPTTTLPKDLNDLVVGAMIRADEEAATRSPRQILDASMKDLTLAAEPPSGGLDAVAIRDLLTAYASKGFEDLVDAVPNAIGALAQDSYSNYFGDEAAQVERTKLRDRVRSNPVGKLITDETGAVDIGDQMGAMRRASMGKGLEEMQADNPVAAVVTAPAYALPWMVGGQASGVGKILTGEAIEAPIARMLGSEAELVNPAARVAAGAVGSGAGNAAVNIPFAIEQATDKETGKIDWSRMGMNEAYAFGLGSVVGGGISLANLAKQSKNIGGFVDSMVSGFQRELSQVDNNLNASREGITESLARQTEEDLGIQSQLDINAEEAAQSETKASNEPAPGEATNYLPVRANENVPAQIYDNPVSKEVENQIDTHLRTEDQNPESEFKFEDLGTVPGEKPKKENRIGEFFQAVDKALTDNPLIDVGNRWQMPLTSKIAIYSPRAAGEIMRFEQRHAMRAKLYSQAEVFFKDAAAKLLKKDDDVLNSVYKKTMDLISDGEYQEAAQFLKSQGHDDLVPGLNKLPEVLKDIYVEGNKAGLNIRELDNFFPHKVKDFNKWLKAFGKDVDENSILAKILSSEEKQLGRALSQEEKADLINRFILNRDKDSLSRIGHRGKRTVRYIDDHVMVDPDGKGKSISMRKLYYRPEESFRQYVKEMAYKIEKAKFFGFEGDAYIRDRSQPLKQLGDSTNLKTSKRANPRATELAKQFGIGEDEAEQLLFAGAENRYAPTRTELANMSPTERRALAERNDLPQSTLDDADEFNRQEKNNRVGVGPDDKEAGIGRKIANWLKEGLITKQDADKLADMLHSRFVSGDKSVNPWITSANDITYALTLQQLRSTLTQILDIIPTVARSGLKSSVKGFTNPLLKLDEINPGKLAGEILDPEAQAKFLEKYNEFIFKAQGFTGLDVGLAGHGVNADLHNIIDAFKKPTSEKALKIYNDFARTNGKEAARKLVGDILDGNYHSEEVGHYLFQSLAKKRPLTKSQSSQFALDTRGSVGPLVQTLHKWQSTYVDLLRTSFMDAAKQGKPLGGIKDVATIAGLMTLAAYGKDEIKEWMYDGVAALSNTVDNATGDHLPEWKRPERTNILEEAQNLPDAFASKGHDVMDNRIVQAAMQGAGSDRYTGSLLQRDPVGAAARNVLPASVSLGWDLAGKGWKVIDDLVMGDEVRVQDIPFVKSIPFVGDFIEQWAKAVTKNESKSRKGTLMKSKGSGGGFF